MFNVGDLIIYSSHGICKIDDITTREIMGETLSYYELHPIHAESLKISAPVKSSSLVMLDLIIKEEATIIIDSFNHEGIEWINKNTERQQVYGKIVKKVNRQEISDILNTLMKEKHKLELQNKKLNQQDQQMLTHIQDILLNEIAIAYNTTFEDIKSQVEEIVIRVVNENMNEVQKEL